MFKSRNTVKRQLYIRVNLFFFFFLDKYPLPLLGLEAYCGQFHATGTCQMPIGSLGNVTVKFLRSLLPMNFLQGIWEIWGKIVRWVPGPLVHGSKKQVQWQQQCVNRIFVLYLKSFYLKSCKYKMIQLLQLLSSVSMIGFVWTAEHFGQARNSAKITSCCRWLLLCRGFERNSFSLGFISSDKSMTSERIRFRRPGKFDDTYYYAI